MEERDFYDERSDKKNASLNCPHCRTVNEYELIWLVRTKKRQLPGRADERDRAKFAKARSYMLRKDDLVVWSEAGGETRIVRIDGKPQPSAIRTFLGDSVGHWEGDTLVVETTGFRPDDEFRLSIGVGRPVMVGPDSKVVERFSRISDDELLYQFTVVDPLIYAKPWLAEYSMTRSIEPAYEFACHEGNYALPDILRGARMNEKRAAAAAEAETAAAQAPAPVAAAKPK